MKAITTLAPSLKQPFFLQSTMFFCQSRQSLQVLRQRQSNQNIPELLQTQIPFAPFLCIGGLLVYFLQESEFLGIGLGF